jgi:hypothetical protein
MTLPLKLIDSGIARPMRRAVRYFAEKSCAPGSD